jgi:hypothetical protein
MAEELQTAEHIRRIGQEHSIVEYGLGKIFDTALLQDYDKPHRRHMREKAMA